jgi:hypothetical protein
MKYFLLLLISTSVYATDNIYIDQVGDNNTFTITQQDGPHYASVIVGKTSASDNNNITIEQKDTGTKNASVELTSGINNTIGILQQGIGNHTASILNLSGSSNGISINQSGAGSHSFALQGGTGTTNSGNTISATQSGGIGAEKSFSLTLNGTSGATVDVTQTSNTSNTGSMTIQCLSGSCGSYSYIRQ